MATRIPSLVFVADRPDESDDVELSLVHANEILSGYWGFEQRSRRREKPRAVISYTIRSDTPSGICRRRAEAEIELLAKVVFPIWLRPFECNITGSSVTAVDNNLNLMYFREAGWVFIDLPDGSGMFFEIEKLAPGGNQLFLKSPPAAGVYTVYPAVIGEKEDGAMSLDEEGLLVRSEKVTFIER